MMGMEMVIPLILGIVIILLGIYAFRRKTSQVGTGERGMDILRGRYASGEIDSAEYQNRKKDLEGK